MWVVDGGTRTSEILRRQGDFRQLHSRGKSVRGADVVIVYLRTPGTHCRYAVVASRKVGKATRRNRAKRVLREAQRSLLRELDLGGNDLLLIARRGAPERGSRELEEQIRRLFAQAGLIHDGTETTIEGSKEP